MERIVLCGLNWLGDSVMSLPAIQAFEAKHPGVDITVVSKPGLVPLWSQHPSINRVVALEPGLAGIRKAASEIRNPLPECAYVLPHSWRATLIPRFAGIPLRIGLGGYPRDMLLTETRTAPSRTRAQHQALDYFALFDLEAPEDLSPTLSTPKSMYSITGKSEGHTVALMPGAARGPSKQWAPERFSETGSRLVKAGYRVLLLGGEAERDLCGSIAEAIGASAVDLAGQTGLDELISVLSQCDCVVANDSGGLHLASACGSAVVGIFGITDPVLTGPLGSRAVVLQAEGYTRSRDIPRESAVATEALGKVSVEDVVTAVQSLLTSAVGSER